MNYGERIKELREREGLNQQQLADKIKGHKQSTISSWETNAYPTMKSIEKVCRALNMDVWKFFAPDNIMFTKLEPEEQKVLNLFRKTPEKLRPLIYEAFSSVVEFTDKTVEVFSKPK